MGETKCIEETKCFEESKCMVETDCFKEINALKKMIICEGKLINNVLNDTTNRMIGMRWQAPGAESDVMAGWHLRGWVYNNRRTMLPGRRPDSTWL